MADLRRYVYERSYVSRRTGKTHVHRDRQFYQLATERCLQHMKKSGPLTRQGLRWAARNGVLHFNNTIVQQLVKAGSARIDDDVARPA